MNIREIKENTYSITVPRGIRYLSQWQDFSILPFPHILDKQIPGCGFTEFCLTNSQDLVLMSPRKLLLENKYDQHKDDIYYVINSYEKIVGPDRDITRDRRDQGRLKELNTVDSDEIKQEKLEFYVYLKNQIEEYITLRRIKRLPFKIITTYDSFYLVKAVLKDLNKNPNSIQFVVDEFQSIFTDSTFKSGTELNYIEAIKGIQNLCFVSATPMIEEYLREIDIFKDLPYYELDWVSEDPLRVKKPRLLVRSSDSAITTAKKVVESYISGSYEYKLIRDSNGNPKKYYSTEAVIYMNSVNNILTVIKGMNLTPDQVNILCADTPENQSRVKRKLGSKFIIGKVPLKGQPHKMFTLCTRTVYLGADFYSTNARSFIISDANIDTLAVDISLDLPQILGRQRLVENPWKDEATFYYKSTCNNRITTKEELERHISRKLERTEKLLKAFSEVSEENQIELAVKYENDILYSNYKNDYVAVNREYINPNFTLKNPVKNNLVIISERRAFDIQQIDYVDRFNMFSEIEGNNIEVIGKSDILDFFKEYEKLPNLYQKLKYLCEFNFSSEKSKQEILDKITEKRFRDYYISLGPDICRECSYSINRINQYLEEPFDKSRLILEIYKKFNLGDKVSKSEIKDLLNDIYKSLDYKATAKASDLEEYFEIKSIKIKASDGKWIHGFKIIKKKEL